MKEFLNPDANRGQAPFLHSMVFDNATNVDQNDIIVLVPPLGQQWRIVGLWFQVPEKTVTGADVDVDIRTNDGSATADIIDGYSIDGNDNTYEPVDLMASIDIADSGYIVDDDEWVEIKLVGAVGTLTESIVFFIQGVFLPQTA